MSNEIKAIIFDWGRTLHNSEVNALFGGVSDLIKELSARYSLALVSLAKSDTPESRKQKIEESGIAEYFNLILVGGENKDEMYERALVDLKVLPKNIAVVDDRMIRGIAWGNRRGATTIWLQKGKFSDELPTAETGEPTFIVSDIREVKNLLS